jgi:hypothetical protein
MARFKVTGESVVVWEVELYSDDYKLAGPQAVEFVQDMLQLDGFASIEAKVDSQSDRVMKVKELEDKGADPVEE